MSHHGMFEYIAVPEAQKQQVDAINMPECIDEDLDLEEAFELHSEIHIKEEPLSEDEDEVNLQAYMLSERLLAQQQVQSRTSTPSPNALVMNLFESEAASSSNHHVNPSWDKATTTRNRFSVSIEEDNSTSTHADSHWVAPNHLVIGMPESVNSSACPKSTWDTEITSPNHVIGNTLSCPKSPETVTASPNRLAINIPKGGSNSKNQVELVATSPNSYLIHIPDDDSSPRCPEIPSVDIDMSPKPLVIDEPSSSQCSETPADTGVVISIPDEAASPERPVQDTVTVTVSVDDNLTVICTTPMPPVSPPRPPEGPSVDLGMVVPVEKKSKPWKITVATKSGQTKTCMITANNGANPNSLSDDVIAQIATAVMDEKSPAVCNVVLNPDGTFFLVDDNKGPIIRPCPISIVQNAPSKPEVSVKRLIQKPVFDSTKKVLSSKSNTIVTLNPANKPSILKRREVEKLSDEVTITSVKTSSATYSTDRRKQDMAPRISVQPVSKVATKPSNTPQDEQQIKIVSYSGSQNPPNKSSISTKQIKIASYKKTIQQKIERLRQNSLYFQFADSSAEFICNICEEKLKGETATLSHLFQHCFVERENRCFVCNECRYECNSKIDLRIHSAKHDIFKFQCPHCRIYLLSDNQLRKHLIISHRETDQVTNSPDRTVEEQKKREELVKEVTENENNPGNIVKTHRPYSYFTNYMCNLCLQKCKSKQALHLHAEAVHNDKVLQSPWKGKLGKGGHLQCHLCKFNTSCADRFYVHVLRHRGISPYFCRECNRSLDTRTGFYKHCRTFHPTEFDLQRMWVEKDGVKQTQESHVPMVHLDSIEPTDEERRSKKMVIIVCSLCSQRFDAIPKLYNHCMEIHSANKLKHFNEEKAPIHNHATLWKNRFAQYGIKGFMCKYCGKLYGYRHGVILHQNLVHKRLLEEDLTGVQKYTCDICQKTALNKHWLQSHINLKHLNPSQNQFSIFRLKKRKATSSGIHAKHDSEKKTKLQPTIETVEKVVEPVLENNVPCSTATKSPVQLRDKVNDSQSTVESKEVADKDDSQSTVEPKKVADKDDSQSTVESKEVADKDDSQSTVKPKKVADKSKSEKEEFDWAYWTSLGLRKSSRKRKKREFSDFIDYEEAGVSKRAEIFDLCKGRRRWIWVHPPDKESPPSSSSDAPVVENSPQVEERVEDETQETTDTPVSDDSKPAVIKRKYVKNTLARKLRRKRSLVMKKKHYKKKIVLGASTEAKESSVVTGSTSEVAPQNLVSDIAPPNIESENTPATLASEVAPQDLDSNIAPLSMVSEVAPSNLVSDITPLNTATENTPTNVASKVTPSNLVPSASLESVENMSISKIPFKKRLSKIGSTENLQVETEHENQVQPVAVQNQTATSADKEKSGSSATITVEDSDTSALVSADNSVITSEQSKPISEDKDSAIESLPEVSLAEAGPESSGSNSEQESKASEENVLVNKNVTVPTKRKLSPKKTVKGKKKMKVETSNPQTENVESIPDGNVRESVIKRTPENNITEAPSLEENKEPTFVPDSSEKPMPVLEAEVTIQSPNTVLDSPVTCSPGLNESSSPITPVSMRKSARERKKKDFVDFVQITKRRSKPNAVEVSVRQEKVESPQPAVEGKDSSNTTASQIISPVAEISSPVMNLKRSRKPSLKIIETEVSPKPGNKRARKSSVNTEVKTPKLEANIDTQVQKKGRKSNVTAEVKTTKLNPNVDTQPQKKGRKSNVNAEVKTPDLIPNIDTPVQKKGRKSNAKTEGKIKENKESETPPVVAGVCEKNEEIKELADASLSVATETVASPTTETQNPDLDFPSDSVPQEAVQCADKESVERPNNPTVATGESFAVNVAENSNCPTVNTPEVLNDSVVNGDKNLSYLTVNQAESPRNPSVNEAENLNDLKENTSVSSNSPTEIITEPNGPPTMNQNGTTMNETENLNSPMVNAAESPDLVSSVDETITILDPKKPQTATTPKRTKVTDLTLSESIRKSSRPRKKREITDFEFL